ncbi:MULTISPECIES: hypothetical protein [unclassified Streptomyces]|uniref:hypothetical protein n=1 Tax=unclassified Streptomyces TaxID=2593676 RepID=UPI00035E87D9|nr:MULTISPECIES: hypothetical protein [unclassified Streptomyces]MYQ77801.1 hypothetical protein [Streptomyces sp. SID4923]
MQEQHEQYAPWGEVTPDFWETGARRERAVSVPSAGAQWSRDSTARLETVVGASETAADGDVPSGPPAEYKERIDAIIAALGTPQEAATLADAATAAGRLDQEFTQRYGERHANTINLRELRGQLAYQQGQASVAVRWCLHTAGLQAQLWGRDHRLTRGSIQRAAHFWLNSPHETQESAVTGQELLAMLGPILGEDSGLYSTVRARLGTRGARP